jgi:RHS repeat-associated protein
MVAGGIRTEYGYDTRHRLTNLIKKSATGAVLLALTYTVDASGMRSAVAESDATGITRTVAYQYDAVKRLTRESIDHRDNAKDRVSDWIYDRVGNRLTQTVAIGAAAPISTSYVYDSNDRLTSESSGANTTAYTYDNNGNTLTKTSPSSAITYTYDDANRLRQASDSGGSTAYVYNADGLRVRQTRTPTSGAAVTTWYLQDSAYPYAQVIEEWTQEGSGTRKLSATFTFADELVSQTRYTTNTSGTGPALTPSTQFVQADGFGSTRWITDAAGAITDSIDYDAFANEIGRSGSTAIEHLYRGERFDANVAMYDLRARLYSPSNGRFLTQDSFDGFSMDSRSLHKYLYANADPVNGSDPSGYLTMTEQMAGAAAGAALTLAAMVTYDNFIRPKPTSSQLTAWDAIALTEFAARTATLTDLRGEDRAVAAAATLAASPRGHHTIPVYLCGDEPNQETSQIRHADHVVIHAQLAAVRVGLDGAEEIASRKLGYRRSEGILMLARTEAGRKSITNAIDKVYYYGGWWQKGVRPIKQVFEDERDDFETGVKTARPWCTKSGKP